MNNIEKYHETKDALEAYNNSVKNVPFDVWLGLEYEERTLLGAACVGSRCHTRSEMKDEVKVFDALKARKVLERVNKFLGILIRESLVKDAQFLKDGEIENERDLAYDVYEVLQGVPRNCDVGTADEQRDRLESFCERHFRYSADNHCSECPAYNGYSRPCAYRFLQMPYEEDAKK